MIADRIDERAVGDYELSCVGERRHAGVEGTVAEICFDLQQAVVFGGSFAASGGAGFDLAAVEGDR